MRHALGRAGGNRLGTARESLSAGILLQGDARDSNAIQCMIGRCTSELDGIPGHERSYLTSPGIEVCTKNVLCSKGGISLVFAWLGWMDSHMKGSKPLHCTPIRSRVQTRPRTPLCRGAFCSQPSSRALSTSPGACPPPLDRAKPRAPQSHWAEPGIRVYSRVALRCQVRRISGTNSDLGSGIQTFSDGTFRHTLCSSPSPTPPSRTALRHQCPSVLSR